MDGESVSHLTLWEGDRDGVRNPFLWEGEVLECENQMFSESSSLIEMLEVGSSPR